MDVKDAIRARKSVRAWEDKPVPREVITEIIEAARLAPSASNRQEWRFIVVTDKQKRTALAEASRNQAFVGEAGAIIVCCAETDNHKMSCGQLTYPIDLAIAIDHMTLRATELGLGSCWIGAFFEDEVKQLLGIPEDIRVVELLPIGYPADTSPKEKKRHTLDKILRWERW